MVTFAQVYRKYKKGIITLAEGTDLFHKESRFIVRNYDVPSTEYDLFKIEYELWIDFVYSEDERNPCFNCKI